MKRKFFSVLVAACAALFSFSGLTGCSGGGDTDSETYGLITLNEFKRCSKSFHLRLGGLVPLKIEPQTLVNAQIGEIGEGVYETGVVVMDCSVNGYSAEVTYCISGWKNGVPEDGTSANAGQTNNTALLIEFDPEVAAEVARSVMMLSSVGANSDNDKLTSSIKVGLQYSVNGCEAECVVSYVKDSETKYTTKTASGSFYVYKPS